MAIVQLAARSGRADVKEVKASFRRHHQRDRLSPTDIAHWCEDAVLTLELICQSVPEHAAVLRKEGARFFADQCYERAAAVHSPLHRLCSYVVVFEKFHYRYFPPHMRERIRAPVVRLMRHLNT